MELFRFPKHLKDYSSICLENDSMLSGRYLIFSEATFIFHVITFELLKKFYAKDKRDAFASPCPTVLPLLNKLRTFDWKVFQGIYKEFQHILNNFHTNGPIKPAVAQKS